MEKRQPQAEPVNVAEFRKLAADALAGDVLDHLDGGSLPGLAGAATARPW
jgi:hypothetical protein